MGEAKHLSQVVLVGDCGRDKMETEPRSFSRRTRLLTITTVGGSRMAYTTILPYFRVPCISRFVDAFSVPERA
jgi:hypothetical protein